MKAGRFLLHQGSAAGGISTGWGGSRGPAGRSRHLPSCGTSVFQRALEEGRKPAVKGTPGINQSSPNFPFLPSVAPPDPCAAPHQDVAAGVCARGLRTPGAWHQHRSPVRGSAGGAGLGEAAEATLGAPGARRLRVASSSLRLSSKTSSCCPSAVVGRAPSGVPALAPWVLQHPKIPSGSLSGAGLCQCCPAPPAALLGAAQRVKSPAPSFLSSRWLKATRKNLCLAASNVATGSCPGGGQSTHGAVTVPSLSQCPWDQASSSLCSPNTFLVRFWVGMP